MTAPVTFVDATTPLRDWLRGTATIVSLVAQRVYAGRLPADTDLPAIVIIRPGGGLNGPVDDGLYQFDCWAAGATAAWQLAGVLLSHLESAQAGTDLGDVVFMGAADRPTVLWAPDPDDDTPRVSMTVEITTRAG